MEPLSAFEKILFESSPNLAKQLGITPEQVKEVLQEPVRALINDGASEIFHSVLELPGREVIRLDKRLGVAQQFDQVLLLVKEEVRHLEEARHFFEWRMPLKESSVRSELKQGTNAAVRNQLLKALNDSSDKLGKIAVKLSERSTKYLTGVATEAELLDTMKQLHRFLVTHVSPLYALANTPVTGWVMNNYKGAVKMHYEQLCALTEDLQ